MLTTYTLAVNPDKARGFGVTDIKALVRNTRAFLMGVAFTFDVLDSNSRGDFSSIFGHSVLRLLEIGELQFKFECDDSDFVDALRERFESYGITISPTVL